MLTERNMIEEICKKKSSECSIERELPQKLGQKLQHNFMLQQLEKPSKKVKFRDWDLGEGGPTWIPCYRSLGVFPCSLINRIN